jgi:hypothetical protein
MSAEKMEVRVEVEDFGRLALVFPRRLDSFMFPYQEGYQLAACLERAATDIGPPVVSDPMKAQLESEQVRINTYKDKYVILIFPWSDRLYFCPEAAVLVARAIAAKSQELDLLHNKSVRLVTGPGQLVKQIVNERTGVTQIVPGRG